MVDSVANVLLETLRDVLVEEVKFLWGVSDEVRKVERDLRAIHALLMEADHNDRRDHPTLRDCIAELKELAFKAENVLETYAVEVESKKQGKRLKKKLQRVIGILCECYSVHQVGNEIDGIRSRLADLTERLRSINGGDGSSSNAEQQRLLRLRYAHEIEQHFVGMEKDIERVVSVVRGDEPRVISICGMGGLGKTTLARKIYHHQDVRGRFDGRAWVCATQHFEAISLWRDIYKQIDDKGLGVESMGLPELVRGLYSVLEQRKCLVVVDDIWDTAHWDILKPAFPTNCKVLLTTRNENIASQEYCDIYKLGFLSEDEGWELLEKITTPADATTLVLERRLKSFEDIGRQIVQKCGRLPLAISAIGGILRQKQHILGEWEKVSGNIDSYLRHGEGIGNDRRVMLVLDLSYDVLPYYLKPCFLYLACFSEDKHIGTEELYRMWIGEGLISLEEKGNNETLRDVAERYLSELAFRCMVQVEKDMSHTPHNKFRSCKLHDLMRDLCSSKAEEEKFIKRIDVSKLQHDIPNSSTGASIHRLAVNLDDDDVATSSLFKTFMQELANLRSFLVLRTVGSSTSERMPYQNLVDFENSKHLRILMLDRFEFEDGKLPSTISKLIYLRYLSLRHCNVNELPQYICSLVYLHTLDLRVGNGIIKLPNLIRKMKRLRHLFLPKMIDVIGGDKLRVDALDELETLGRIHSKTTCIADVVSLSNLRKLIVIVEEDKDSLSKIAEYMSNNGCQLRQTEIIVESCHFGSGEAGRRVVKEILKSPSLVRFDMRRCEIGGGFPCYEQGMCQNLVELAISDSRIKGDIYEDVVREFGKYPILQKLWFRGKEQVMKTEMRFDANSFPELEMLYLSELLSIGKWEVEKGAMPKLRQLTMYRCSSMEKLPEGLRFIPTLVELQCWNMSEELKARMIAGVENGEVAGVDYANFSHIPNVFID